MADGLTRTQAEAELRRLMANTTVFGGAARRTVEEAGGTAYIDHLEHVMERKRTTITDYRGYLRSTSRRSSAAARSTRSTGPASRATSSAKNRDGLSAKTIQNHLNFLHGISASR